MSISSHASQKVTLLSGNRPELPNKDDILIGHDLLELLTRAMYVDPLAIYREYIQNATDAIEEARQQGTLGCEEAGLIDVHIDSEQRSIRIRDNGASIPGAKFVQRLLAIGSSNKRGKGLRGFRGIGRLAGLGYCQELVFRGRVEAREPVMEISLSAKKLRDLLNSDATARDLQTAMSEIATKNRTPSGSWPSRFFEVELHQPIRIKNDVLLNPDAVCDYLSQVAPAPFREDFRYRAKIEEFLHGHGVGEIIEIKINENTAVRRPHQSVFSLAPNVTDQFCDIEFIEIPGLESGLDAVGWVLDHSYLGALSKGLRISGLRVRAGNLQIGDSDILAELFSEPRFNSWCVGEFHILNKKIIPNGRRDEFEHSPHYLNFQSYVSKITTRLSRTCRVRSGTRNLLKATKQNLQKIQNDLIVIRSIPHNFRFRKKHLVTLSRFIKKQQINIDTKLPHIRQREELLKLNAQLQRQVGQLSAKRGGGALLKRLAPAKRKAYAEVLSAIYEVTTDASVAHDYVNKILRRLRLKKLL
jgi:hypothetical protein